MNSLRNLFSRKSTTSASSSPSSQSQSQSKSASSSAPTRGRKFNSQLKGKSYDSAIALDPPVKGSYPVAGNGPNVFEEIQRSRARRESRHPSVSSGYAEPPTVPRWRDDGPERPRTAPHSGLPSAYLNKNNGRTMSGFAAQSPPSFPEQGARQRPRRFSALSASDMQKPADDVKQVLAYQPRRGRQEDDIPEVETPPPLNFSHNRTESTNSRASHIDLLHAYTNMVGTREISRSAVKASGVRNYGEDVADRNIVELRGTESYSLTLPQYGYTKDIYSPAIASGRANVKHDRFGSTSDGVQEQDDDTVPPPLREVHGRTSSLGPRFPRPQPSQPPASSSSSSSKSLATGGASAHAFPARVDSSLAYQRQRGFDDAIRLHNRQSRTVYPEIQDESPSDRTYRRRSAVYPLVSSHTDAPGRERAQSFTRDSIPSRQSSQRHSVGSLHDRTNPADSLSTAPVNFSRRSPLPSSTPVANESRTRPRTSSAGPTQSTSQLTPRVGSSSYSSHPAAKSSLYSIDSYSVEPRDFYDLESRRSPPPVLLTNHKRNPIESTDKYDLSTRRSPPPVSMNSKRNIGTSIGGAKEKASSKGVAALTNTIDTEVVTKTSPAVTHEYVTPNVHHVREEAITREIHTHDVFHRILPVIETEILPTKHYIQTTDGKLVEIPEDQIPGRTATPSFQIVPRGRHSSYGSSSPPGGSVVHIGHQLSEHAGPVLSSKRESMTRDGVPKTESVWRHTPEMETGGRETGQTIPMHFHHTGASSDSDSGDSAYTTIKTPVRAEEKFLFRETGYGDGGMLPGLAETAPAAVYRKPIPQTLSPRDAEDRESTEGEATKALRRRREAKMRLSKAYDEGGVEAVQRGLKELKTFD